MRPIVSRARGWPLAAIAPTFQMTPCCEVEIARADQQQPTFVVGLGEISHHLLVKVTGEGDEERRIVRERIVVECRNQAALLQDVVCTEN